MDHKPHVGTGYNGGLAGRKVAIVGYSHHKAPDEEDNEDFTRGTVEWALAEGSRQSPFWRSIASYFGSEDLGGFWNSVIFFNFLPRVVGTNEQRYDDGTPADSIRGGERAIEIINKYEPDALFVFSRKAWEGLPPSLEDASKVGGTRLLPDQVFDRHHYRTPNGHVVQAFGLRHPQWAERKVMSRAVAVAMQMEAAPPS